MHVCVLYTDSHAVMSQLLSAAVTIGRTHSTPANRLSQQFVDAALAVRTTLLLPLLT